MMWLLYRLVTLVAGDVACAREDDTPRFRATAWPKASNVYDCT